MAKHPDVTLKWACDVNPDNAKNAAEQFHVPETTTDFMEVVNDPEVDMIKIATTHEAHLPIIEAAAKAGKHIFCEKPMAMHDKEAYLIMKAVRPGAALNFASISTAGCRPQCRRAQEMARSCGKSHTQSVALY